MSHGKKKAPACQPKDRKKIILKTSFGGVAINALLGAFKIVLGILSGSVAVIADALTNLTDAGASIVIILGMVYADKSPNRKHPYGYGRFEYMMTLIIAGLVLYAGVEAIRETIEVIEHPHEAHYTVVTLSVIIVSIIAKVLYGIYARGKAHEADSKALHASGSEAIHHSLISLLTLGAAVIHMYTGLRLEALASGIIGAYIIYEGITLLREALAEILGQKVSGELSKAVRRSIMEFPEISGAYDLHLHDYGPDRMMGSVHIEVPDTMSMADLDKLERDVAAKIFKEYRIILAGIGIYANNTSRDSNCSFRDSVKAMVLAHDNVVGFHGFYVDVETRTVSFDMVIGFDAPDRRGLFQLVSQEVRDAYPDYNFKITQDLEI